MISRKDCHDWPTATSSGTGGVVGERRELKKSYVLGFYFFVENSIVIANGSMLNQISFFLGDSPPGLCASSNLSSGCKRPWSEYFSGHLAGVGGSDAHQAKSSYAPPAPEIRS
ncbi:hypothetical protein LWI28_024887 [Acer negundo]|uniref:Uncharacterized protein n=1 Tax=Acer negundo TaxID=4023 RepID=A0AAD5IVU3_ACENE|nr:hypothetical protein LWI28_024887 [Acer negundo]